jgi:hypothetical protein
MSKPDRMSDDSHKDIVRQIIARTGWNGSGPSWWLAHRSGSAGSLAVAKCHQRFEQ